MKSLQITTKDLNAYLAARLLPIGDGVRSRVVIDDKQHIKIEIQKDKGLQSEDFENFYVRASLSSKGTLEVERIGFYNQYKGKGFSRLAVAALHDLACLSPQGLQDMDVTACKENGVSYWLRLGFFPFPGRWSENIGKKLLPLLEEQGDHFTSRDYAMLYEFLTTDDPRAFCHLAVADIQTLDGVPAQKAIGLYENNNIWFMGELAVDDPHYAQFFLPALAGHIQQVPPALQNKVLANNPQNDVLRPHVK